MSQTCSTIKIHSKASYVTRMHPKELLPTDPVEIEVQLSVFQLRRNPKRMSQLHIRNSLWFYLPIRFFFTKKKKVTNKMERNWHIFNSTPSKLQQTLPELTVTPLTSLYSTAIPQSFQHSFQAKLNLWQNSIHHLHNNKKKLKK